MPSTLRRFSLLSRACTGMAATQQQQFEAKKQFESFFNRQSNIMRGFIQD